MACGTPVVALDNSAFPEFSAGAALLLPDAGVTTLRTGITSLLADEARLEELAAEGPRRASGYDWRLLVPRYVDLLEETARG
ncbi:MAG: hypothetical protein M3R01_01615 [Actinomycetota bacterium]|nr:hypothetical protein [Actinomycetota bacterium]